MGWDWVHLVRRPLIGLLYQPWMVDKYGAIGGMRIGRGKLSTRRKPAPVPLCPPPTSHDLTWDRSRTTAVGGRRLTSWAMARPLNLHTLTYLTLVVAQYTVYKVEWYDGLWWLVNNDLEWAWKEALVSSFESYRGICLEILKKITKNLKSA
jgi:hypothetical protein